MHQTLKSVLGSAELISKLDLIFECILSVLPTGNFVISQRNLDIIMLFFVYLFDCV